MDKSDHGQREADQDAVESFTPQAARAAVGRWSVDRYVSLIRPWVALGGLAAVLLVLFQANRILVTVVQAATCLWIGYLVSRRRGQRVEALTAGTMAGLSLGLFASLSRFALEPSGYWFVNILFETIIFGLVGAMLSAGIQAAYHTKTTSS